MFSIFILFIFCLFQILVSILDLMNYNNPFSISYFLQEIEVIFLGGKGGGVGDKKSSQKSKIFLTFFFVQLKKKEYSCLFIKMFVNPAKCLHHFFELGAKTLQTMCANKQCFMFVQLVFSEFSPQRKPQLLVVYLDEERDI